MEMSLVWSNAFTDSLLSSIVDTDGLLETVTIGLFINPDHVPLPSDVIGDYDVPTYTGYAAEAVTWLAESISDTGEREVIGTAGEFRATNDAGGQDPVYGAFLIAGGVLQAAALFEDGPYPMGTTLQNVIVSVRLRLRGNGLIVTLS